MNPTPNRVTRVFLEGNNFVVQEPAFKLDVPPKAVFVTDPSAKKNLVFKAGWTYRSFNEGYSALIEQSQIEDMNMAGLFIIPQCINIRFQNRRHTHAEAQGIETGISSEYPPRSLRVYFKSVGATDNWSTINLVTDQAVFSPPPSVDSSGVQSSVPIDRVAVSHENDDPETSFTFYLDIDRFSILKFGEIARVYFSGSSSNQNNRQGKGQYVLRFFTTGFFELWERDLSNTWQLRSSFRDKDAAMSSNLYIFHVIKNPYANLYGGNNGSLLFHFDTGSDMPYAENFSLDFQNLLSLQTDLKRHIYFCSGEDKHEKCNFRIDLRRDVLAAFTLIKYKYPNFQQDFKAEPFSLPTMPVAGQQIFLSWVSEEPSGTFIDVKLYNAETDHELVLINIGPKTKSYVLPAIHRRYYVKVFFYPRQDGSAAPTFMSYSITKHAKLLQRHAQEIEISKGVLSLDFQSGEKSLDNQTVKIKMTDRFNEFPILNRRSSIPLKIVIEESGRSATIFRGLTQFVEQELKRDETQKVTYNLYSIFAKGIYQVLSQNVVETPYDTLTYSDGTPYFVLDMIRALISRAGFEYNEDFEFPSLEELPFRIVPGVGDFSKYIDMFDKIGDVVESFMADYIPYFLYRNENLGPRGKWIMLPPALKDPVSGFYTPIARFTTNNPGHRKLTQHLPSYQDGGIPVSPIRKGSFSSKIHPPEANFLVLTSVASWDPLYPVKYQTQALHNPISYDVKGMPTSDPNHPDYLGRRIPLYVVDMSLASSPAMTPNREEFLKSMMRVLARRIANLTFHARRIVSFQAPYILVPDEMDLTKNRGLRYYDPVRVDGVDFLVRSVNLSFSKSSFMYATYELEAPRF